VGVLPPLEDGVDPPAGKWAPIYKIWGSEEIPSLALTCALQLLRRKIGHVAAAAHPGTEVGGSGLIHRMREGERLFERGGGAVGGGYHGLQHSHEKVLFVLP